MAGHEVTPDIRIHRTERRCLVKYEMQYIRAWEIEDRRRRREIADLESMRVKYQKERVDMLSVGLRSSLYCFCSQR